MLTDGIIRISCNKGAFGEKKKKKNLNYRLLEQLPVRISSIERFGMK